MSLTPLFNKACMNKIKGYFIDSYRIVTAMCIAFTTCKLICSWHKGCAKKTGYSIDASIRAAAEKLEKTAMVLENVSGSGIGEHVGKDLDDVLMDTQRTLEHTTRLVRCALHRAH